MISYLLEAASEARRQSRIDGTRTVEIVLTEDGFVIRGVVWIKPQPDPPPIRASYSQTLDWPEFDVNPVLLLNSVQLVGRALDAKEAQNAR